MAGSTHYCVRNPVSGAVLEAFDSLSPAALEDALDLSWAGYLKWSSFSVGDRAAVLARAAALFSERAESLGAIVTDEIGKMKSQAVGEARFCESIFAYFSGEAADLLAEQPLTTRDGACASIQTLPIGPILGIMPWNYPYYQIARFVAPNLALGNAVLVKPATNCPKSALAVQSLMEEAGVPSGVYQTLLATHDQIETVIADDRVRGVSITGSERAGSAVAALAGKHLKKVVLELGGSDAYIILDTADVRKAARDAWRTRMQNCGQACNSNKRIIVMESFFDEFLNEMVEQAAALRPGDPASDERGCFPPMATRSAALDLAEVVKDAMDKGARLHAGGHVVDSTSAYFQPAVLTGVTPEMRAWREELFGPVAVIYAVQTDEEALALANDSPFGLGGAVFSTDTERARRVAEALDTGMANVNTAAGEGADLPFGGVKRSGFGRELGPLAIGEFSNKRLFYVAP